MITFFLKFPNETMAQEVLAEIGIFEINNGLGSYREAGIGWAFDPVGPIARGGSFDPETGEVIKPPTVLPGWHANYIAETLPPELEPYSIEPPPRRPSRVFA